MTDPPIAITVRPTEIGVRAAMRTINRRLGVLDPGWESLAAVEIALTEALNNIVEHSFAGRIPQDIGVRITREPSRLWIELTDTGNPYPGGAVPMPVGQDRSRLIRDPPEGGFGWALIHRLTSAIRYERRDGQNHLSLFFDIRSGAAPN